MFLDETKLFVPCFVLRCANNLNFGFFRLGASALLLGAPPLPPNCV